MDSVVITGGALIAEEINIDVNGHLFPILKKKDVSYEEHLGKRGLKYLTEATKMNLITSDLAKELSNIGEFNPQRTGVVVATNLSSLTTTSDFDITTLKEGPRAVSAMQGPNLVLNAVAARLGIHFNATGFNATISSGRVASIDALEYAYHLINKGDVDIAIVSGVEEKTEESISWLIETKLINEEDLGKMKQLSGSVILESESHAKARGAKIFGRIIDFCSVFNSEYLRDIERQNLFADEYSYIKEQLLNSREDINNICMSDNRYLADNNIEEGIIRSLFNSPNIISIYDIFDGDLCGATGVAQLLHSLNSFVPGVGIIFNSDWTGNFRGLLLEKNQ